MAFENTTQNIHIEQNIDMRNENLWDKATKHVVHGQNFAVVCIIGENCNQKCQDFGLKIYGSFPTLQEANDHAALLSKENDYFDYFVMPTRQWVKLPPQVESLENIHYQEKELEKLREGYLKAQKTKAVLLEERMLRDKEERKRLREDPEQMIENGFEEHKSVELIPL